MKKSIHLLPLLCLLLCTACKSKEQQVPAQRETPSDTLKSFTLPQVPDILVNPEQRAEYLASHYWDHFDFNDTAYIHLPDITEQAWANYCNLLNHLPLPTARKAMKRTIELSGENEAMFIHFTQLAEKYLYDPNSPMRNEEFYIPVLETMIHSPLLDSTEKIRPKALLKLAHKNRIGTQAIDFPYTLASGKQSHLHALRSDFVLLFFNNPDCQSCAGMIKKLKESSVLRPLLQAKRLTLLAIYPDEELEEWRKHLADFPPEWINAYSRAFNHRQEEIYDLKAIPTLYLLDKAKNVLLKDATIAAVEAYLSQPSVKAPEAR